MKDFITTYRYWSLVAKRDHNLHLYWMSDISKWVIIPHEFLLSSAINSKDFELVIENDNKF